MTILFLEVLEAQLQTAFGRVYGYENTSKPTINGQLKLARADRLELGTGESMRDHPIGLHIREASNELVGWVIKNSGFEPNADTGIVGGLHYIPKSRHSAPYDPDDEFFIGVDLFVPSEVMASLVRLAENGRFIRDLTVTVEGLTFGRAPDGSELQWLDNAERRVLAVSEVKYTVPIFGGAEDHDHIDCQAKRPGGADLAPLISNANKYLKAGLMLIGAIGLLLFWKLR